MQKNKQMKLPSAFHLMPSDNHSQIILEARATQLSMGTTITGEDIHVHSYVKFKLGPQEQYGIPYEYTNEIMHHVAPTHLPYAPSFVAGIINRRGSIISVLDLKQYFGMQSSIYDNNSYIIIVTHKDIVLGILADNIEGSFTYDSSRLDPPLPSQKSLKSEHLLGLHDGKVAIINIVALFTDIQAQLRVN